MSTRIYALAKDLNVDAKALIDLCQQLGFSNNLNALTNLTDNQVAKIRAHSGQIPSASAFPQKETASPKKSVFNKITDKQSCDQKNQRKNRRDYGVTTRLYSLAKELKIESKVLVDICRQLGIKEKANALTNLTEDDVAKIKAYLK